MARASGSGVISGLHVRSFALARGQTIRISAGHGLTPSGDIVMLSDQHDVPLLDLPLSRQLDAAMGLREEPRVPLGRRTGLFVLALRSVEFTSNPIAAYPRSITGRRTVEDGDIIEATAITLIPYPDKSGAATLSDARRAVAKEIFTEEPKGLPQDALPLAMIAVDRGTVRWIDTAMVRRETGTDSGVQVAFGGRHRAIAEAHILQHQAHLADILSEAQARGLPPRFAASQYFSALPPAGQLPALSLQPDEFGFSQFYFPPSVDVDIAFVPQDEIGALVEESLVLPPIDLQANAEELDSTAIVIMIPVSRQQFQRFNNSLSVTTMPVTADPATGKAKAGFDLLSQLVTKRRKLAEASERDEEIAAADEAEKLKIKAWHAAFQEAISGLTISEETPPLLWYTRRRAVAQQSKVVGVAVAVSGDDIVIEAKVNENIERLGLSDRLKALNEGATPQASARIMALLGSRALSRSDILTAAAIADLEKVAKGEFEERPTLPVFERPTPAVVERPSLRPDLAIARPSAAIGRASSLRTISPSILGRLQPASAAFATARAGLSRAAIATALGTSTAARTDTKLKLGEGEIMDVANDYSSPMLGEGLEKLDKVLGEEWPAPKGTIWLGESGKALNIDTAFRTTSTGNIKEFAEIIKKTVEDQNSEMIDKMLEKMR